MLKFGLFLGNQQPADVDCRMAIAEDMALVRYIDQAGWSSVWKGQHFLTETVANTQPTPFLARAAAEVENLSLGLGVILLALHNPVDVAETYSNIDALANGRLIFGVGLGYRTREYHAFGINENERVQHFEKNLQAVIDLWTKETVTIDLPWCRVEDARIAVRPIQRPRPPIWVGANSDNAVLRAARLGDAWIINPHATLHDVGRQLELHADERVRLGRSPAADIPLVREIYCGADRESAFRIAAPFVDSKYKSYASWGQDKALPGDDSFLVPFEQLQNDRFVIGSPADCVAQLDTWIRRFGVTHMIFRTHWSGMSRSASYDSVRRLSEEVIPELRSRHDRSTPPATPQG